MSIFKLPIFYLENKETLDENIIKDLEFLELNGNDETHESLLQTIINPQSNIGKEYLHKLCEYYTNDVEFLKQTQSILSSWEIENEEKKDTRKELYDKFDELWKNIKQDENFIDRYYYVDVDYFKFLNNSSSFLQLLSLYNLISPILTIIIPIILPPRISAILAAVMSPLAILVASTTQLILTTPLLFKPPTSICPLQSLVTVKRVRR